MKLSSYKKWYDRLSVNNHSSDEFKADLKMCVCDIAAELKRLYPNNEDIELTEIIKGLENFSPYNWDLTNDPSDGFDCVMDALYDWADQDHISLWIEL